MWINDRLRDLRDERTSKRLFAEASATVERAHAALPGGGTAAARANQLGVLAEAHTARARFGPTAAAGGDQRMAAMYRLLAGVEFAAGTGGPWHQRTAEQTVGRQAAQVLEQMAAMPHLPDRMARLPALGAALTPGDPALRAVEAVQRAGPDPARRPRTDQGPTTGLIDRARTVPAVLRSPASQRPPPPDGARSTAVQAFNPLAVRADGAAQSPSTPGSSTTGQQHRPGAAPCGR